MSLVGKRQRGITNALEIGNGILEGSNIVGHPSCNSWRDIAVLHAAYNTCQSCIKNVTRGNSLAV